MKNQELLMKSRSMCCQAELTEKLNDWICSQCRKIVISGKRAKHKFNAKSCESEGIKFSSKRERAYFHALKIQQERGEVVFFLRQVPFFLPGNTKYVCDFQIFYADGTVSFVDVKGVSTPMFVLKKKQVEDLYPIKIEVVK